MTEEPTLDRMVRRDLSAEMTFKQRDAKNEKE